MNPHKLPFIGKLKKSIDTLHPLDQRGLLYEMDYYFDYRLFEPLLHKITCNSGCSTMFARTPDNTPMVYRNYDFRHYRHGDYSDVQNITGLNIVVHNRNKHVKYQSIAIVDGYWLDMGKGNFYEKILEDGKTDISSLAIIPFLCMEGMNSQGLQASIMALACPIRWDEVAYFDPQLETDENKSKATVLTGKGELPDLDSALFDHGDYVVNTADKKAWVAYKCFSTCQKEKGKKTVFHPVLIRMILDNCATVQEAVALAESVNIKSPQKDSDFHIFIADKFGSVVILEWIDNKLVVVPTTHGTNYYCGKNIENIGNMSRIRDKILADAISSNPQGLTEKEGVKVLDEVSQDGRIGKFRGFTQWSATYNLNEKTLKLWVHRDYKKCYEFEL